MGKTSKWLRNILTGKKDQKQKGRIVVAESNENQNSVISGEIEINPVTTAPGTPREKRRWSFRRSSATAPATTPRDSTNSSGELKKRHPMTVAAATTAAAEAAAAAVEAAAAVIRLNSVAEEAAATKIQAYFRAYLSRKALRALRGLVKLQALVRGHLVRKQATATLRCMQALIALQAKARAQRLRLPDEEIDPLNPRLSTHRKSTQEFITNNIYHENDKTMEENIKIVEIDMGEMKVNTKRRNSHSKQENLHYSPSPSAITDIMSPRAYSSHFEDYNSFVTAQSTPNCNNSYYFNADSVSSYDYPLFPNYMANTQSSRAKARSQSAPKQRPPEVYERQMSGKRRVSMEGTRQGQGHGHVPRAVPVRMQRASSNVGSTAKEYRYPPWMAAVKLDRSNVSVKESECGSTSTVLTTANYCRSLVAYDVRMDL